ncbi:MAG: hypothetical protein ACYDD2_02120 [Candidatus Acidiferrales bacterium]
MKHTVLASRIIIVIFSMSALAVRARAQSQSAFPELDFSATMVVTSPNGKAMSMKVYRLRNKMRSDMPGGKMHSVLLLDKNKYFMVTSHMCMEMAARRPQPLGMTGSVVRKDLGSAIIDGDPTKIEEITITPADGRKPVAMKAWEATDLKGLPLRIEMATPQGQVRTEYKDVDLSSPPESLFAVPQNCRTMPMVPGMPHPGQ